MFECYVGKVLIACMRVKISMLISKHALLGKLARQREDLISYESEKRL